jgi:hypothetical protein
MHWPAYPLRKSPVDRDGVQQVTVGGCDRGGPLRGLPAGTGCLQPAAGLVQVTDLRSARPCTR